MLDFLGNLKIDAWYKWFAYMGAAFLLTAIFFESKAFSNNQIFLLGLGSFLIGVGEWKNHKVAVSFKQSNAYTGPAGYFEWPERHPDALGIILDIVGGVSITIAFYSIFRSAFL